MIVKLRISKHQFERLISEEYFYGTIQGNCLVVNIYDKITRGIKMLDVLDDYISRTVSKENYSMAKVWRAKLEKTLPDFIKNTSISVNEIDYSPQKLQVISIEGDVA